MLLAARFREIGLTAEEARRTPPRHAALREDPAALALRLFRDRTALTAEEQVRVFAGAVVPTGLLHCRLDIVEDLYLFSDWPENRPDEVLPPGETTAILYRAAQSFCPAARILDLGCGSGTLALLLAARGGHATGTDINPRAIALAQLNAEVNGIAAVDFRTGSLFEPVTGERFDLIVSQPPYIPRPAGTPRHLFLHGGERGDELARQIVAALPEHLTPQGRALVFSDWSALDRIPAVPLRTRLFVSPPLTGESYAEVYGVHAPGVRQCLAVFDPGSGVTEQQMLPHQWPAIARYTTLIA